MLNSTIRSSLFLRNYGVLNSIRNYRPGRPKKTVSKYVQVQLLQDIPHVGVKGEIKLIKPGFMKNYLYVANKACYVNADCPPKIPVVEPEMEIKKEKVKKTKPEEETVEEIVDIVEETEPTAMSLEELSTLFSSMKKTSTKKSSNKVDKQDLQVQINDLKSDIANSAGENFVTPGQELDDTKFDKIYEVSDKLPKLITIDAKELPFGKDVVIQTIRKLTGESLDGEIAVSYLDTPEETLSEITDVGRYQVKLISADGKDFVLQTLDVEEVSK